MVRSLKFKIAVTLTLLAMIFVSPSMGMAQSPQPPEPTKEPNRAAPIETQVETLPSEITQLSKLRDLPQPVQIDVPGYQNCKMWVVVGSTGLESYMLTCDTKLSGTKTPFDAYFESITEELTATRSSGVGIMSSTLGQYAPPPSYTCAFNQYFHSDWNVQSGSYVQAVFSYQASDQKFYADVTPTVGPTSTFFQHIAVKSPNVRYYHTRLNAISGDITSGAGTTCYN
jgi:hypothetical protein